VNIAESSSQCGPRAFVVPAWMGEHNSKSISQLVQEDDAKFAPHKQNLTMTKVTAQAITRIAVQSRQNSIHDMFNETALMLACVQNDVECVKTLLDPKACSNICYIAATTIHPRSIGQDALFMALNHLNFEAASCILNRLLQIARSKAIAFDSKQHVGTRDIIKILEARHHINRVNSLMLILRHGQLELLEKIWELLKAAEKKERKHPPEVNHVSRPDGNAYFATEIMRRMLNGPGMYEDACAHHVHVNPCECNGFDCNGQTAFHHAVRSQKECVVRWAIVHGGNICWQPPMSLQVSQPARAADTAAAVSVHQSSIPTTRKFFDQMFLRLAQHRKAEMKKSIDEHVKKVSEELSRSRIISIDNENVKDCLHLFECLHDRSSGDSNLGLTLGSILFDDVCLKLGMLCEEISSKYPKHHDELQRRMIIAKDEMSKKFPRMSEQSQQKQLNFQEFVVVFGFRVGISEEFCDCLDRIMSKIRNLYKMNYLKAAIGIRRSEDAGEKELESLIKNYSVIKDISEQQRRKYQLAFAIFDLDDDKTISIDELVTTLRKYGKEYQLMDCYSLALRNSFTLDEKGTCDVARRIVEPIRVAKEKITKEKNVDDGFKTSRKFKEQCLNLEEFMIFMMVPSTAVARGGSVVEAPSTSAATTEISSTAVAGGGGVVEVLSSSAATTQVSSTTPPTTKWPIEHEFKKFCANVLDIMLQTSNDLGSIYRTLDCDHQKTFRSTEFLGKVCREHLINLEQPILYNRGYSTPTICAALVTFVTGDLVWTEKNGLSVFEEDASCYVIPPFNTKSIRIKLDYGDGKVPKEVGLGSMFGYEGAFEHRYRNHTATISLATEEGAVDSSIPYLYKIDLKKLKRLKDMGASASNELFTQKELSFINEFRESACDFSQLQDNTSLASVTEHGKVRVRLLAPNNLLVP
jgi:hypothetical protein